MARTYHISANAYMRKRLLQSERMASLLIDVLSHYRDEGRFALHAFVVMPDHFHALVTLAPGVTIERAMQYIKGGFSYRAKKEFGLTCKMWQPAYHDHRVRTRAEFDNAVEYIHENPVVAGLCERAEDFSFSSAAGTVSLDGLPQWLKPKVNSAAATAR